MDIHLYLMVSVQLNRVMKEADLQHMSSEEPPGSRVPGPGSRVPAPGSSSDNGLETSPRRTTNTQRTPPPTHITAAARLPAALAE